MDLVDISNEQTTDLYRGNDNRQDILNTQLALATRVISEYCKRAEPYRDEFELINSMQLVNHLQNVLIICLQDGQ